MSCYLRRGGLLLALLLLTSVPAFADTFTLTGGPSAFDRAFIRPNEGNPPTTQNGLVLFDIVRFTVDTSGPYTFTLSSTGGDHDPFLVLYRDSFNEAASLANVIIANDDGGGGTTALFTVNLTAGQLYFAILTNNSFNERGSYLFTIDGPGAVTNVREPLPEPATMLLLGTGLAGVVAASRRRRRGRKGETT